MTECRPDRESSGPLSARRNSTAALGGLARTSASAAAPATRQPPKAVVLTLCAVCCTAISISAYLAWTALAMREVVGCGGGEVFDCGHVLTSQWSKWLGIPVGVLATGMWASILAALMFAGSSAAESLQRAVWRFVTAAGFTAGLAAIWFISLQIFLLEHLCTWCLAAHSCAFVLTGVLLWYRPVGNAGTAWMGIPAVLGLIGLAGVQYVTPAPQQFVVERFDVAVDADEGLSDDQGDDFDDDEAGEYFSAPGEVFAPPGGELFEPPGAATHHQPPAPPGDASATQNNDDGGGDGDSSVASSLLLITPFTGFTRRLLLGDILPGILAAREANSAPARATQSTDEESTGDGVEEARAEREEPAPRLVSVRGNRFTLNARQWPLIGDPDAKYIFVEMLDYTCPHCRNTHRAVKGACQRYGDDLAVIILPVPLNRACNPAASGGSHAGACELANLAVAVWRTSPDRFHEYHDWLMDGGRSRTPSEAEKHARTLVGADALKAELASKVPAEYVKRHVDLYRRVSAGSVPKLMFPNATLTGEVSSTDRLCRTIEQELALSKRN